MLSIPPVVILVFFKQQNPLYLNLYVRYFFLYVIVFLFFSFFLLPRLALYYLQDIKYCKLYISL